MNQSKNVTEVPEIPELPRILIIGSGVAGVKCAFALADLGYKVILQDLQPYLGGKISQLYKQFPTDDCGWCKMLPQFPERGCMEICLRRNIIHKNITLLPYSKVLSVLGDNGIGFDVRVQKKTRLIDESKCTACGLCIIECPVKIADDYNSGQTQRKAIWMRNSGPVPRIVTVDIEHCTKCGKCVEVCPTKAVDLKLKDVEQELKVTSIVLATGYEEALPEMTEYGYGKFPNVITNMELERMISGDGIGGVDLSGKNVGIIQCVGSRSEKNDYCSYACCMYALKEAMMIKKKFLDCNLTIYYMDMRAFGRDYYRYQKQAEAMGIKFTLCKVPAIDNGELGKVSIKWTDEADIHAEELDYAVLSIGQRIGHETRKLIKLLGIKHDKYGFIETETVKSIQTSIPGIYACGSASGPKDIPESVTEALAVTAQIASEHPITKEMKVADEEKPEVRQETEPRIALFLCICGVSRENYDTVFSEIIEKTRCRKSVVISERVDLMCQPEQVEKIKQTIVENKVTRVLFAACAPYQYETLFEGIAIRAGISPEMVDIVDIREQGFWVNTDAKGVQRKILSGLSKLLAREPLKIRPTDITKRLLVVGGGVGGLNAALILSRWNIPIDIIERDKELGGNLHKISKTIDGTDVHKIMMDFVHKIKSEKNIRILYESEVARISGYIGNFSAEIKGKDSSITEKYGAVLIASGGNEYKPEEYEYGQDKRILTQSEFEHAINAEHESKPKKVAMIQCVGSRDQKHPYCSRICCLNAIKNALSIKEHHHDSDIYIMHRDIMTYGLTEKYYTDARKSGINFIRFSYDDPPKVHVGNELCITVRDRVVGKVIEVKPDVIVLSAGIVPNNIKPIVEGLKLETTPEGFVKEANVKFRPVDTLRDGVFVCGLAHSPRNISETLVQSEAATAQIMNILLGKKTPRHTISEVSERWCIGCEMCIGACPYGARIMDEDKKIARVIEPLCRGCGVCAVVCPSESSRLVGYRRRGMMDVIDEILEV